MSYRKYRKPFVSLAVGIITILIMVGIVNIASLTDDAKLFRIDTQIRVSDD